MATVTKNDVKHVADLSNLVLTDEEIAKFTPQLDKIIEFVSTLNEVDTSNVEPTSQTTGLTNVLREDIIKSENSLTQDEALSNTDGHNGFFKVKAILKNRTDD
jgi:aspartyl-tRNA(Asn)/glutamyl-tRNA(Gln) amidotransferase subunit C